MQLNPESLSFALLISDLGSIARAANILGMKQATLSRKLTALESRVGVRLFDRSARGAVPTVSGAGFLNQARRIHMPGAVHRPARGCVAIPSGGAGLAEECLNGVLSRLAQKSLAPIIAIQWRYLRYLDVYR
jgi:hypothetical protein